MSMLIQLHGAFETNNYGDLLLGKIFGEYLINKGHILLIKGGCKEIYEFFGDKVVKKGRPVVAIFCGGGYLCDGNNRFTLHMIKTIYKEMFLCRIRRIPYYIIGAGTKEFRNRLFRPFIKYSISGAQNIIVRNDLSKNDLEKINIHKKIKVTTDNVMALTVDYVDNHIYEEVKRCILSHFDKRRKIVLIHINSFALDGDNHINDGQELLMKAIWSFSKKNNEFNYLIVCDHPTELFINQCKVIAQGFDSNNSYLYIPDNISQMLAVIKLSDFVITTKLHVGITATAFHKSIVSFPIHPKTLRFYAQLQMDERVMMLKDCVNIDNIINHISNYLTKPLDVKKIEEIHRRALYNFDYLDKILDAWRK